MVEWIVVMTLIVSVFIYTAIRLIRDRMRYRQFFLDDNDDGQGNV